MAVKLSDIVDSLPKEALVFMVLNSVSPGESISSKYGNITRVSDTEYKIEILDQIGIQQDVIDDGDPDAGLRKVFS